MKKAIKWGAIIIIAIIVIAIIIPKDKTDNSSAATSSESATKAPTADVPLYKSEDVNAAYQKNEVAADNIYKGNRFRVTGRVTDISKDFTDAIYITLSTGQDLEDMHCNGISAEDAAALHKGQQVTVEGEGAGMVMQSVMLNDCKLIK